MSVLRRIDNRRLTLTYTLIHLCVVRARNVPPLHASARAVLEHDVSLPFKGTVLMRTVHV